MAGAVFRRSGSRTRRPLRQRRELAADQPLVGFPRRQEDAVRPGDPGRPVERLGQEALPTPQRKERLGVLVGGARPETGPAPPARIRAAARGGAEVEFAMRPILRAPMPRSSEALARHLDLRDEEDPEPLEDRPSHRRHQLPHVPGGGPARVDDHVGVLPGHLGPAAPPPLQAARVEQLAGLSGRRGS